MRNRRIHLPHLQLRQCDRKGRENRDLLRGQQGINVLGRARRWREDSTKPWGCRGLCWQLVLNSKGPVNSFNKETWPIGELVATDEDGQALCHVCDEWHDESSPGGPKAAEEVKKVCVGGEGGRGSYRQLKRSTELFGLLLMETYRPA